MSPQFAPMSARQIETVLLRHGFLLISQRGSHRKWRNPETGAQVIVPFHKGKQLPIGTLRQIIKSSEIAEENWKA